MKKRPLAALPLLAVALFACGERNVALTDYVKEIDLFRDKDSLRVVQLTDIHWSLQTDVDYESRWMTRLIEEVQPDLIIGTGDQILIANERLVRTQLALFDSWGIPFSIVYGNHDKQGEYGPYFWGQELKKCQNALYSEPDDDIHGESNWVINITDGTSTKWQIYGIDSNNIFYTDGGYKYDVIREEQIDWYEQEVLLAKENNGGTTIPSLAFFHIPLWESELSYRAAQEANGGKFLHWGEMREKTTNRVPDLGPTKVGVGFANTGFFAKAEELGSTKGMFYGHDHINNFGSNYATVDGGDEIFLGYGAKTGIELYRDLDMLGATVITIHKDGTFVPLTGTPENSTFQDYEHVYISADAVEGR